MIFHNQPINSPELYLKSMSYQDQVIDDLFLSMITANVREDIFILTLGQKIKFSDEPYWYEIKAITKDFVICWNKRHYTIIDLQNGVRGPGTSWGLGHETDEQILETVLALHGRHPNEIDQEVSRRNRVNLDIEKLTCDRDLELVWVAGTKKEWEPVIKKMGLGNSWMSNIGLSIFEKNNIYTLDKGILSREYLADDYTIGKFESLDEAKEEAQKFFLDNYKTIPVLNWEKDQITA